MSGRAREPEPSHDDGVGSAAAPDPVQPTVWPASEETLGPGGEERGSGRRLGPGARIGRYLVLERIGAGGMGVVYAAYDPELDRKIALKLLLPGGSAKGHTRLLREAQALAKLAHPHVVAIHDVGVVDEQVWLAMEFVRGTTLSAWLRQPRGWREVLAIMQGAGAGLVAAHAAGLLHRDFKPDNVMVGDDGRVRVMDFGLARARGDRTPSEDGEDGPRVMPNVEALSLQLTQAGAVVGTPRYMAPEQLRRAELTAAADQFSFCVVLWEALYGERPFEGRTLVEIIANVLAGRPRSPPKDRAVPSRLRRACERGLSIDPQQRWPSMDALLAELRRLTAAPARRWTVLGVTAGLMTAGGGLALARYIEVKDRCTGARAQLEGVWDDARREAVRTAVLGTAVVFAEDTAARVEQRLDAYAEAWIDAHTEACEATRVTGEQTEEAMARRMECLHERRTALRAAVDVLAAADADVVTHAVSLAASLPPLARCDDVEVLAEQHQRLPPPEDPAVAREVEALREQLAAVAAEQKAGRYARALQSIEPIVARAEALGYAPLRAEVELRRGVLLFETGEYDAAEQRLEAAHALAIAHEHDAVMLLAAQVMILLVGERQARPAEGLVWGKLVLPLAERLGDDLVLATSLNNLGSVRFRRSELEQAEQHYRRSLRLRERALGPDHPDVAATLSNLGNVLQRRGELEQARLHLERALGILEQAFGSDHPHVGTALNNLGNVLESQGAYEASERHHRRALEIRERALGPEHPSTAMTLSNLGNVLAQRDQYDEAERHHRRALEIREKVLGLEHPDVAVSASQLGHIRVDRGDHAEASRHFERALRIREKVFGPDHVTVASSLMQLGYVASVEGRHDAARAHAERAVSILAKSEVTPRDLAHARFLLAKALGPDPAERSRARALAQWARAVHAEAGETSAKDLAEVEAWLAGHPAG